MPDERDPQNAAPSADGDISHDTATATATATATEDPPEARAEAQAEVKAEATAEAGEEAQAEPQAAAEGSGDSDGDGEQIAEGKDEEPATGTAASAEASVPESTEAESTDIESTEAASTEAADEAPEPQATAAASEPEPVTVAATAETGTQTAAEAPEQTAAAPGAAASEPEDDQPTAEAVADTAPQAAAAEAAAEAPTSPPLAEPLTSAAAETAATPEAPTAEASAEEPEPAPERAEAKAEAEPEAKAEPKAEAKAEAKGEEKPKGEDPPKAEKKAKAEKKPEEKEPELDDPALLALREAKEKGSMVTGKVIGWNRGGFHVVIDEVTAFCPASEMELGRPRSPETYMDRELEFKVAKFQRRGRRVVLSRAELLKAKRDEIVAALKPGTVVSGTVTSLPEFGAFVDLGGIEGLVHVSEISRSRVSQPKDVLQLGQQVEVKVLKVEKGGDRISLSLKELEPDPWKGVAQRYPRGSKFSGKILRHADFGMFVELEPDVEGLVHVSQLAPGSDLKNEALQPGKPLEGWVREVDPKRQRISLSLREVPDDDPWKDVAKRLPEGEMVEGTVESIAPFGVFINLAPGLTGLLPNAQTGLPRGTNAARAFRPGQKVSVQILSVDSRRKRISLGKEGSRVEATKADLQDFRKQQREEEKKSPSAMEAAFARLGLGGDGSDEE